jgi:hypothetical protein
MLNPLELRAHLADSTSIFDWIIAGANIAQQLRKIKNHCIRTDSTFALS